MHSEPDKPQTDSHNPSPKQVEDDPVYVNGKREAWVVFLAWLVAGIITIAISFGLGHGKSSTELTTVLGLPSWVFWGVLLPWMACLAFAGWFCFGLIQDDDLGLDPEEREGETND